MTPQQANHRGGNLASPRPDVIIRDAASGRRNLDRSWHLLRAAGADLDQWTAFATVCRGRGRNYDATWARHQWLCWTVESEEGTYPQQRAKWAAAQHDFAERMRAKSRAAAPVRTNADLRQARCKAKPQVDHAQLRLFS